MLPLLTDLPRKLLTPARLRVCPVDALYVHIPFCFHKCHYCDFYSITKQTFERMDRFVDLLLAEARLWQTHRAKPATVFFGGGTPSLLPLAAMRRLIIGLGKVIDLAEVEEFTIEVNPATASLDYLQMLRAHGVDRLSFGAQSFHRDDLKMLERHHDPDDVPRSVDLARQAGFERINLDLIYAVPGQTLDRWHANLRAALGLSTDHLSCYALTYEEGTAMTVRKRLGQFTSVAEDLELDMLRLTRVTLDQAGLAAYEISNYAKPGNCCRHNLAYWRGLNYIGLGPSAASHLAGLRFKNLPHLGEWESVVASGQLPGADIEELSPICRAGELIMLGLRLAAGVELAHVLRTTGIDPSTQFASILEPLLREELVIASETHWRLSPRGVEVADAIASQFVSVA